jgi:hypothetical protein
MSFGALPTASHTVTAYAGEGGAGTVEARKGTLGLAGGRAGGPRQAAARPTSSAGTRSTKREFGMAGANRVTLLPSACATVVEPA